MQGFDVVTWIGFDLDRTKWCEFRNDGSYGLSSDTSCDNIYGGDWSLVRHSYNSWHQATDNLAGIDSYGSYDNDPQSINKWSIEFNNVLEGDGSSLFMFSNGDCSEWFVTRNDQFNTQFEFGERDIIASHYDIDYDVLWYNRVLNAEDPWISWLNHSVSNYYTLLYGENNWSGSAMDRFQVSGADLSVNVWIKIEEYFVGENRLDWLEAKAYCEDQGATLASIHSLQDWNRAKIKCQEILTTNDGSGCWFGLNDIDQEGTWQYVDNSTTDYGFTNNMVHYGQMEYSLVIKCSLSNVTWTVGFSLGGADNTYQGELIDIGESVFNELFKNSGDYPIIRRECVNNGTYSCASSHQDIYYKRLSNKNTFDAYDNMKVTWSVINDNIKGTHFDLYSSLQDALSGTINGVVVMVMMKGLVHLETVDQVHLLVDYGHLMLLFGVHSI